MSSDANEALALHTAARRYCLERHAYWCYRYSKLVQERVDRQRDGYHFTPEALATFPRYNVLNAIRVELERIHSNTLGNFETTKALLILAGQTAEDEFTRKPLGKIEALVINEEREAYCRYVASLSAPDVSGVEPLPFRRVLSKEESSLLWSRFRERWHIRPGYWYPLDDCDLPNLAAFKAHAFDLAIPPATLQNILRRRGIERVWELREYGPEYEQDVSLFGAIYNGAEGYWSAGALEWIVYASHENSITVGGWLLEEVAKIWPSWREHYWTDPPWTY